MKRRSRIACRKAAFALQSHAVWGSEHRSWWTGRAITGLFRAIVATPGAPTAAATHHSYFQGIRGLGNAPGLLSVPGLRKLEWEAIAGLVAALAALILHFLHITEAGVLGVITLVLVALLFLRHLRNEVRWETLGGDARRAVHLLEEIKAAIPASEIDLIGPSRLRCATAQFAGRCHGEVVWFNACPEMLATPERSDAILHPFLINPDITTLRFVLDHRQRELWQSVVQSTLEPYLDSGKVDAPCWGALDSGVSFLIGETDTANGKAEALVSFWGEPFMATHHDRRIPG
jgi:hypothetical protein